jgi:pimeloyl-ACP methyl ester carboxylesterase
MTVLGVVLALLACGIVYQQIGRRIDRRRCPPPGQMIDVGGHRLHLMCAGSGTPLVLFESAIAASALSWSVVRPKMAAVTSVCVYDRSGLGWSEASSGPRTFDRMLDELRLVLDRVSPGAPCVLVGHSFGSFVVRAFAARHPDRVLGLVLVDPALEWLSLTPERRRRLRGARYLSWLGALLAQAGVVRGCLSLLTGGAPRAPRAFSHVFGRDAARTLARLVGEVRKLPPEVHDVVRAHWSQPKGFRSMAQHFQVLEREGASIRGRVPPSGIPVTVISGGDQPDEQRAAQGQLAAASRAGRHLLAARGAHWVQFDEPDLVVAAVTALVELLRRQPPAGESG